MYPEQNNAVARAIPASLPPPDTLASRLQNMQEIVRDSEDVLSRIRSKLFGPTPEVEPAALDGSGVNAQVMDVRTRALRIRDQLLELDAYLA